MGQKIFIPNGLFKNLPTREPLALSNMNNARDTTNFTTKCLQIDVALICHSAISTLNFTGKH